MSAYGIDVSHHQGAIDWQRVAASGKQFAVLKATEGTSFLDSRFHENRREATRAGIVVGAYHYFRPGLNSKQQAEHFFATVGLMQSGDMIPWLDVEDDKTGINGATIPPAQIVRDLAETLAEMDRLFGVKVGVYTGLWFWDQLPVTWQMDRPLWVAYWYTDQQPGNPKLPKGWDEYAIHQYTSKGRVDGIQTNVDLDWIPGELSALQVQPDADEEVSLPDIGPHLQLIRSSVDAIEKVWK